jgi:hypothetical protein
MTNSDKPQNYDQDDRNFQNANTDPKSTDSDSYSKDIIEKDTQKNLIDNDPSEGFETDSKK